METLTENMVLKRLCLPLNTDFENLRSGNIKKNNCDCGGLSKHIACVLSKKGRSCLIRSFIWYKYLW